MTCTMPCIQSVTPTSAACADVIHAANGLSFGLRGSAGCRRFPLGLDLEATGVSARRGLRMPGREPAVLDRLVLLGMELPVIVLAREATVELQPSGLQGRGAGVPAALVGRDGLP